MGILKRIFGKEKKDEWDLEQEKKLKKVNVLRKKKGLKPYSSLDEMVEEALRIENKKRVARGEKPFENIFEWRTGYKTVEEFMKVNSRTLTSEELKKLREKYCK